VLAIDGTVYVPRYFYLHYTGEAFWRLISSSGSLISGMLICTIS
jgi:hypothetical protein